MTNSEFSSEFDILYNNIMSNQAPGLDDYEKSVFLTKAQEEIALAYYTGRNESGDYLEGSEEVRNYLYPLVRELIADARTEDTPKHGLSKDSKYFIIDNDYLAILSEYIITDNDKKIKVVPITNDEFLRIEDNPFRGPSKSRVLRSDAGSNNLRLLELITSYNIKTYVLRVLLKPEPIILEPLSGGLKIGGSSNMNECKLDSSLHRKILDRAVLLAKASFASNPGQ